MAYSMTGFGRGEMLFATRKYSAELKSVNSRYCDINIRMPRILNFTDNLVRKMITDRLGRGKIDVYISFDDSESASCEVVTNLALAEEYSQAIKGISEKTGRTDDLTATRLAQFQDVLSVRQKGVDEDSIASELCQTLDLAIDGMLEMRKAEAKVLCEDIFAKVDLLEGYHTTISKRAPLVVDDYRARLAQKIEDILSDEKRAFFDENRLSAEVTVFADKCAIDEELKRLSSHFMQAKKILASEGLIGKKMDFLIQEFNREVNTIGSKANDIEITNSVMLMKNEVEKIREQVQNLA